MGNSAKWRHEYRPGADNQAWSLIGRCVFGRYGSLLHKQRGWESTPSVVNISANQECRDHCGNYLRDWVLYGAGKWSVVSLSWLSQIQSNLTSNYRLLPPRWKLLTYLLAAERGLSTSPAAGLWNRRTPGRIVASCYTRHRRLRMHKCGRFNRDPRLMPPMLTRRNMLDWNLIINRHARDTYLYPFSYIHHVAVENFASSDKRRISYFHQMRQYFFITVTFKWIDRTQHWWY